MNREPNRFFFFFQNSWFNLVFDWFSLVLGVFIGPNWLPIPSWTDQTSQFGPIFKTMDLIREKPIHNIQALYMS